jgi:hypothetical protein
MPENIRFSNPDTMQKPPGYSHVVEVTGPGRTVYFAGQLGIDKSGKMGANAREQMEIAFENVKAALASVGASFENVVTSPPSETPRDLADFHQRQDHAPRFAGKGRETALRLCRVGRYEGRSAGRLRASSQRVERRSLPPGTGSRPPLKNRDPPGTPLFYPAIGAAHVHRTVHFSPSFLRSRYG